MRPRTSAFVFLFVALLTTTALQAQVNWTRSPKNPVFTASTGDPFDFLRLQYAFGPAVLRDASNGFLNAWFEGLPFGAPSMSFGRAASPDGEAWYYYSRGAVLKPGPGSFDAADMRGPCVIKDAGGYKMYYSGNQGSTFTIGLATSADGFVWQKYPGNPVLTTGPAGSWDDAGVLYCKVLLVGQTYYMWYSGRDGVTSRIGLATSADGLTWTKSAANPVLNVGSPGTWDATYVEDPAVVLHNGLCYMVYTARPDGQTQQIGLATSPDGVSWQKYGGNPVLVGQGGWENARIAVASLLFYDNKFHLWFSGAGGGNWQAGYAWSNWEYPPNPQPNVLVNPGFESGTSPWSFFTDGSGTFASVSPGNASTRAGRISITAPGSNVQLRQSGFRLEPNTQYILAFDAYCNTGHDMSVFLHRNTSPFTIYGINNFVVNLTPSWQRYSLVFTTTGFSSATTDTRLRFWFSPYDAAGDQFFIDNVTLSRVGGDVPPNDVGHDGDSLPAEAVVGHNYPNPFNPSTNIEFSLPQASRVRLEVYSTVGERVAELLDGPMEAGRHSIPFNASNLATGTYFYRLSINPESGAASVLHGKMLLVK